MTHQCKNLTGKLEFERVGQLICDLLDNLSDENMKIKVKHGVRELTDNYPMTTFKL